MYGMEPGSHFMEEDMFWVPSWSAEGVVIKGDPEAPVGWLIRSLTNDSFMSRFLDREGHTGYRTDGLWEANGMASIYTLVNRAVSGLRKAFT